MYSPRINNHKIHGRGKNIIHMREKRGRRIGREKNEGVSEFRVGHVKREG